MDPNDLVRAKLLGNLELGVVTIWYNTIGRIIHVGGILPIHLPMVAPGEMDHEVSRATSVYESLNEQTTLDLPKAYAIDLGSSLETLYLKTMTTITCRTYKSKSAGLLTTDLQPEQPFSLKEELVHNQYSLIHYVQPTVIWKYVIPEHPLLKKLVPLSWWKREAEIFCQSLRNIREHQISPCLRIDINQIMSDASGKTQAVLSLAINLSSNLLNILSDPTKTTTDGNITLSYIHSVTKNVLDQHLVDALCRNLRIGNVSTVVHTFIATSVDIICPTGTQLTRPPTSLSPVSFTFPRNNCSSPQNASRHPVKSSESAYALTMVSVNCEACPFGYSPREPYSFAPCIPCPRGFFRGKTGWPSASGCLACPAGFTTLREGSTSPDDCVIDGGTFTRAVVGLLFWAYRNFMELIVAAHEASMSYTKRVKLYLSDESKVDMLGSSTHWINRIKPAALAVGIFYSLLVLLLLAFALYRLLLIYRFKRLHSKHLYLLRKSIVIGQLNSQDDVKDLVRQDLNRLGGKTPPPSTTSSKIQINT